MQSAGRSQERLVLLPQTNISEMSEKWRDTLMSGDKSNSSASAATLGQDAPGGAAELQVASASAKRPRTESQANENMYEKLHQEQAPASAHPTSSAELEQRVGELVEEIKALQQNNQATLKNFKEKLLSRADSLYNLVAIAVQHAFEESCQLLEPRIQELVHRINQLEKVENEMVAFRQQLGSLYSHLHKISLKSSCNLEIVDGDGIDDGCAGN